MYETICHALLTKAVSLGNGVGRNGFRSLQASSGAHAHAHLLAQLAVQRSRFDERFSADVLGMGADGALRPHGLERLASPSLAPAQPDVNDRLNMQVVQRRFFSSWLRRCYNF